MTRRPRLSLDGTWEFSYDALDHGEGHGWHLGRRRLPERIVVPGCSQARDFESAVHEAPNLDVALPEQSNTIMLRYPCMAPSWYVRRFVVPRQWERTDIHLHVGGVKPAGEFWLNGHKQGQIAPRPRGGVRVVKIDMQRLRQLVHEQPDATIRQLHHRLGAACCESAVDMALGRLGLSFK